MELYTEADMKQTARQLKKRVILTVCVVLVIVAWAIVFDGPLRQQIALLAGLAVLSVVLYYIISVKLVPWARYYAYQRDIAKGRFHETDCRFISFSDSTRMSDGVAFHDFVISLEETDSDDEEERLAQQRLLLWDADKPKPDLAPGQKIFVRSFGNYVTAYHPL